jgi:GAF domain-containing protein
MDEVLRPYGAVTSLNDQLRGAFDSLADRVRDDVARHARELMEQLTSVAEAERADAVAEAARNAWSAAEREVSERLTAELAAAEREASERLTAGLAAAEREADARLTSSVAAAEARTRDEVRQELQQESERALQEAVSQTIEREQQERAGATARILTVLQTMDRAQSLSDVLQALADAAAGEAPRLAIFLVKGARLQAWRLVGFDAVPPDSPLEIATSDSGLIGDAARSGSMAKTGAAPAFANLPPDRPAVAIPLAMSRQPFAVLYADQGAAGDITQPSWATTLEILGRHAARALEALTASRLAQAASSRSPLGMSNVAN